MKINGFLKRALLVAMIVMLVPFGALSQETANPGKVYSQAELDQMLAPIALYPDALLAQLLVASTFPTQIAEADRWLKHNAGLTGDKLNSALDTMDWDLSVKALAPFPQVLAMLAQQAAWSQNLGQAFLAQESDVMASIQRLRSKASAAGNLQNNEQQKVVVKGEAVEIVPANSEVVYVPRYDPAVVYGAWSWPEFPPAVYYPVFPVVDVAVGAFGFWGAVAVGPVWGWGWGSWDWGGGFMNVNVNRNVNINSSTNINRNFSTADARNVGGRGNSAGGRTGGSSQGAGSRTGNVGRGGTGSAGGHGAGAGSLASAGGGSRAGASGSGGSRSAGSRSSAMHSGGGSRTGAGGGSRASAMGGRSSRSGGSRSSAMHSGGGSRAGAGGGRTGGGGGKRTGGGGGGGRKR